MLSNVIRPSQREDLAGKLPQEVFEILKEEGAELTDEELEMVVGGGDWMDIGKEVGYVNCPECGQVNLVVYPKTTFTCSCCGKTFTVHW